MVAQLATSALTLLALLIAQPVSAVDTVRGSARVVVGGTDDTNVVDTPVRVSNELESSGPTWILEGQSSAFASHTVQRVSGSATAAGGFSATGTGVTFGVALPLTVVVEATSFASSGGDSAFARLSAEKSVY